MMWYRTVSKAPRVARFEPTPTTSLASVSTTKDRLILKILDNRRSRDHSLDAETFKDRGSEASPAIRGISCSCRRRRLSFRLLPAHVYLPRATPLETRDATQGAKLVSSGPSSKAPPAFFDSSNMWRFFESKATSKDGTTIPHFVIRTKGASAHALVFIVCLRRVRDQSQTPGYAATIGAGWLERGATYVVANIRGGGEFGPTGHLRRPTPRSERRPSTRRRIGHAIDAAPYRREPFLTPSTRRRIGRFDAGTRPAGARSATSASKI